MGQHIDASGFVVHGMRRAEISLCVAETPADQSRMTAIGCGVEVVGCSEAVVSRTHVTGMRNGVAIKCAGGEEAHTVGSGAIRSAK